MKNIEIGEWVKGPFANATIEGFIVNETHGTYSIRVKSIAVNRLGGSLPEHLTVGSDQDLPKRVVYEFFRVMNNEQQHNIVALAVELGQVEWAAELVYQFINVNTEITSGSPQSAVKHIYSKVLNRLVSVSANQRKMLYCYYLKALDKGMPGAVKGPGDIINAENFDAVVSAIVLVAKDRDGTSYIESLVNGMNESGRV